jgi:RNA polymerase sigma-B factor
VRRAEASLLISELVTGAMGAEGGASTNEITITVDRRHRGLCVEVTPPLGSSLAADTNGFRDKLLDRMSRRWGYRDHIGGIWFEVALPGAGDRGLAELSTSDLLRICKDDPAARDVVVTRLSPMALGLARRYRGKGLPDEDLEQVALFALTRAIERFDPELGHFEPYATITITGEIKRFFRDRGWFLSVPRTLKDRAVAVGRIAEELTQRTGKPVPAEEIAAELGIAVEEVEEAQATAAAYRMGSLDAPIESTGITLLDALRSDVRDPGSDQSWHEAGVGLSILPERERRIVWLRFSEGMSQSEIAQELGISQMHVSRLLSRALQKMRAALSASA